MKVAVLYICIGKYTVLWPEFYDSCRKYFFKNKQVHYFVFTDSDEFINSLCNELDVTCVKTKNYGWPGNTFYLRLMRIFSLDLAIQLLLNILLYAILIQFFLNMIETGEALHIYPMGKRGLIMFRLVLLVVMQRLFCK